jgi:hypothetical protein
VAGEKVPMGKDFSSLSYVIIGNVLLVKTSHKASSILGCEDITKENGRKRKNSTKCHTI